MCDKNNPCNSGDKCDKSTCTSKIDVNKLKASKALKSNIISNNLIVKK